MRDFIKAINNIFFKILNDSLYFLKCPLFNKNIIKENKINIENTSRCRHPKIYSTKVLSDVSINIRNNSILILEIFPYHYECTPGFSKYFIDLRYKVDIIMNRMGLSSFCYFVPIKDIRIFSYKSKNDLKKIIQYFSLIINKYEYILIETTQPNGFNL